MSVLRRYTQIAALALVTGVTVVSTGCSVARDQQTVGSYIDDAAITTAVKARFVEDKAVSANAISVESMKGTVQLSGFARTEAEKDRAGEIARKTKDVVDVRNNIIVRP